MWRILRRGKESWGEDLDSPENEHDSRDQENFVMVQGNLEDSELNWTEERKIAKNNWRLNIWRRICPVWLGLEWKV